MRSTAKNVFGQVITIVLGQVVTTVLTFGRLVPMAQPTTCAGNDRNNNVYLTTTCERFTLLVNPSVLAYNQYCKG